MKIYFALQKVVLCLPIGPVDLGVFAFIII